VNLSYYNLFWGLQGWEAENALEDRTYLRKCLTQCHKSIHLALEVKTFFDNYTPVTGPNTESNT
jgi:hypothetical protein